MTWNKIWIRLIIFIYLDLQWHPSIFSIPWISILCHSNKSSHIFFSLLFCRIYLFFLPLIIENSNHPIYTLRLFSLKWKKQQAIAHQVFVILGLNIKIEYLQLYWNPIFSNVYSRMLLRMIRNFHRYYHCYQ